MYQKQRGEVLSDDDVEKMTWILGVGVENDNIYCYGSDSDCLWNSGAGDCTTDADCQQYNSNSLKHTDYVTCNDLYAGVTAWYADACNFINDKKIVAFVSKHTSNPYATETDANKPKGCYYYHIRQKAFAVRKKAYSLKSYSHWMIQI